MKLFDLLSILDPEVTPQRSKIHLAGRNGREHPIDVYTTGGFNPWQRWQSKKNFKRDFVISLIKMNQGYEWLFAGTHDSPPGNPGTGVPPNRTDTLYHYDLIERPACKPYNGRIVFYFKRSGRQSYLDGERWSQDIKLQEIYPEPVTISNFPGFKTIDISKTELDHIIRNEMESWKAGLSSVAGVYLISDTSSGALYVGSAVGEGGIWQRWCNYSATGHGGNRDLREVLKTQGPTHAENFRFSVLEIADTHADEYDVRARESHWKRVLMSRDHGLNAN